MDLIIAIFNLAILLFVLFTLNGIHAKTEETRQILTILHYKEIEEYLEEMTALSKEAPDGRTKQQARRNTMIAKKLIKLG